MHTLALSLTLNINKKSCLTNIVRKTFDANKRSPLIKLLTLKSQFDHQGIDDHQIEH
jgi:hypothetical protein